MLKLDGSVSSYNLQVKNGTFDFPSYSHCCPICHEKDCPIRHGYYFRQVIDEKGKLIEFFPIARFICRSKGKAKLKDRTFSLLPWQLIPYRKYMIAFLFAVSDYQRTHSKKQSLDNYTEIKEQSQLYDITKLLSESLEKLKISLMINPESDFNYFISYCQNYVSETDEKIRGPTGLSWDYYNKHGGYYQNSWFLIGCAAQFC